MTCITEYHSSFGGHSGDGSVSASGLPPHADARRAVSKAETLRYSAVRKPLLDSI